MITYASIENIVHRLKEDVEILDMTYYQDLEDVKNLNCLIKNILTPVECITISLTLKTQKLNSIKERLTNSNYTYRIEFLNQYIGLIIPYRIEKVNNKYEKRVINSIFREFNATYNMIEFYIDEYENVLVKKAIGNSILQKLHLFLINKGIDYTILYVNQNICIQLV
jgi:hypothetical protein